MQFQDPCCILFCIDKGLNITERSDSMQYILDLLDSEAPSGNAIFLLETATAKVFGGNREAIELFQEGTKPFDLKKIFKSVYTVENLIQTGKTMLETEDIAVIKEAEVLCQSGTTYPCVLNLMYATDNQDWLLIFVKIQEDRRPYFLRMLLEGSKRPAFFLEYGEELIVRDGNDAFYKAFACSPENIDEKYQRKFELFIDEEDRASAMSLIYDSIQKESNKIVNVILRTARGDALKFYYSQKTLKHLIDEEETLLYCLLVGLDDTLREVESPFHKS